MVLDDVGGLCEQMLPGHLRPIKVSPLLCWLQYLIEKYLCVCQKLGQNF